MNHAYRTVWNASLGVWQVASELTPTQGKKGRQRTVTSDTDAAAPASPSVRRAWPLGKLTAALLALGVMGTTTMVHAQSVGGAGGNLAGHGGGGDGGGGGGGGHSGQVSASPPGSGVGASGLLGNYPGGGAGGSGGGIGQTITSTTTITTATQGGNGGDGAGGSVSGAGGGGGGGGAGVLINAGSLSSSSTIGGGSGGNGGNANSTGAGGGGGGGSGVLINAGSLSNTGTMQGGIGGNGGNSAYFSGGGGGSGGSGVMATGGSVSNSSTIKGGNGGNGGTGTNGGGWSGGSGGKGGAGATIGAGTLSNTGTISGGNGGTGIDGGSNGAGGAGVAAAGNATIINAGLVSGGVSGGSTPVQASAVDLTGGGNLLELESGYGFTGNVVSASGSTNGGDTLALGSGISSFNVSAIVASNPTSYSGSPAYYGFASYEANPGSGNTVTLTGTTTAVTPWTVSSGVLSISSDAALGDGSGTLTLDGATLQTSASIASTRNVALGGSGGTIDTDGQNDSIGGPISGGGCLTVTESSASSGMLTLSGTNTYSGGTTIGNGAALSISNDGNLGVSTGTLTFNGGLLQTTAGVTSSRAIVLATGTGTIDVHGQNDTFGGVISGSGVLSVVSSAPGGGGTLTLSGANTYSGGTTIASATLALSGNGSIASSRYLIVQGGGTLDISATTSGASVTTLDGIGAVTLGAQTLTVTHADDSSAGVAFGTYFSGVIGGTGGLTVAGGTQFLSGANAYTGATVINSGATLALTGIGGSITSSSDVIANGRFDISNGAGNSILQLDGSGSVALGRVRLTIGSAGGNNNGVFSGSMADGGISGGTGGSLAIAGGTQTLTGTNTYTGGTTISAGTLQIGNGGTTGSITGNVTDNGALVFDHSDAVNFAGVLSGTGSLTQAGTGTLTLDGNSSAFAGNTTVAAGTLVVGSVAGNGATLGGSVTVDAGATLRGHGSIGGNVDVQSGGIVTPGDSIGTLTVSGNFTAAQGSLMDFAFGAPGANFQTAGTGDSVTVGGNLILNGATLNVTNAGGMGPGLYTVFSYAGTLTETNGGIALGTIPSGQNLFLQNLTAQKQINLIDTTGYTVNAWNANGLASSTQMGGGSGTWSATSQVWTDATATAPNGPMSPQPGFAVFGGTPGTVTVDDSAGSVNATGLQFAVNGYTLSGGAITLVASNGAAPIVRVGDGASDGAGMTATINSVIAGSDGLTKTDLGTLVLAGANTYAGGTTITGGTLEAAGNGALGSGSATVDNSANQGATLKVDSGVSLGNPIFVNNGGTLDNAGSIVRSGSGVYAVESDTGSATITNTGSLQSDSGVILNDGGTVTNNGGSLIATGSTRTGLLVSGAAATITNTNGGSISGGYIGVQMLGGSLDNTGTHSVIQGGGYGVFTNDSAASVTNAAGASIQSTGGDAVSMYQGGTVTNEGGASISGTVGVRLSGNGSVINQTGASIAGSFGVILAANGTVDNSASIVASDTGVVLMGSSDTLVNATGALIRGSNASVSTAGGIGAVNLTNAGTLDGDVLLADGAANAVTLLAGSTLQGQLHIGSNTSSTLALDGSGTQLYSQAVTGATTFMGALTKLGGGTWILDSDLTPSGTTVSTGTLQIGNGGSTGAITGNVADNGTLAFDRSDAVSFAGVVSGGGTLTQMGSGTLTLTGANTYSGGTTISAGTLQIGNGSSTGSITGNVANNGTLAFDRSDTADFAGVVSGSGALTQMGNGTLILTGVNTYAGGTMISAGTLQIGNGGTIGAISGNVTDNDTLAFDRSDAVGFAGVVSGSGALTQMGTGTLSLTGINTYSGVTTIASGTLILSGNGSITDSSEVVDKGTFDISGTNSGAEVNSLNGNGTVILGSQTLTLSQASGSFSGVIAGTGGFTLAGGNEILSDANTYTGATTIASGTLALSGNGSIASSSDVIDNGALDISGTTAGASIASLDGAGAVNLGSQTLTLTNAAGSFGGAINGTGGLTLAGGTEILTGTNTYTGGTAISAGTLQLGNGGTAGAINGNVADNGTLAFDHSDAMSFAGVVSGSGALMQAGSGTLTLTGANTYSGGTTISAGTLVADSTSLPGAVADNATLVFDQASNGSFNGAISGNGSFAKTGTGMLILDGNSGAFTGFTTVSAGTLEVGDAATPSAVLGGNITVASGGTLRGHGTVLGNVSNSGTVWAGGSIGTLTIQGNYTQTANGVFEVEATPGGQASLLSVGGAASLAGTALVLADTGAWAPRTSYTVLTAAGGVSGQFASTSVNLAFLTPVLSYATNAVTLSLQRNDINFNAVAQTPNQQAVASAANALGFGNPVYDALVVLDAPTARHAFDQLSGEIHASTRTAIADDDHYVRDAISQHLAGQANNANGLNVTDASGVTAWTATWGHWGSHDGDGNAADLATDGSGFLVGADLPVGGTARLGAVLGTGEGTARIATQGASSHIVDQHLGLYGSTQTGALLWQGAAIYGWQKVSTNRFVGFGTFGGSAVSSYHAHTAQAYVDGSLPFVLGNTTLAPFANLAVERVSTPTITESGTPAALAVASQDSTLGYGTLGLRATFDLGAPSHGLHAHASLGWQHAWGDTLPVDTMRFEGGGDSFAIAGTPVLRNAGVFNTGISFTIAPNVSVDGSYQGQFGQHVSDQSARISLDWKF